MRVTKTEQRTRAMVENTAAKLIESGNVRICEEAQTIIDQALEMFRKELIGKALNMQDGEHLVIHYRIDILRANGKVRGGSGAQRNMPEYIEWRKAVFERDNWTCQECGAHGEQAHHIKQWAHHSELRFDVDNGITLCKACHAKKHPHLNWMKDRD